ncbi:MAG: hypothetical protein AAF570_22010 [Bacteroidota bacterium]
MEKTHLPSTSPAPESASQGAGYESKTNYPTPVQAYSDGFQAQTNFPVQRIPVADLHVGRFYRYMEQPGAESKIGKLTEIKSATEIKFHNGVSEADYLVEEELPETKFGPGDEKKEGVPSLDYCYCENASLALRVEFNRQVLEEFIRRHEQDRTANIRIISLGPGGLFQDFKLIQGLLEAGFVNITVDLVDRSFVPRRRQMAATNVLHRYEGKFARAVTQMRQALESWFETVPLQDRHRGENPLRKQFNHGGAIGNIARVVTEEVFGRFFNQRIQAFSAALRAIPGESNLTINSHSNSDSVQFPASRAAYETTLVMGVDVPEIEENEAKFLHRVVERSADVFAKTLNGDISNWRK